MTTTFPFSGPNAVDMGFSEPRYTFSRIECCIIGWKRVS